jgi:hypothetical protein
MFRKSCSILFILTIVGAIIGSVFADYADSDKRVEWEYIGIAPEDTVGFVNTYRGILLKGSSGSYYANCGLDCWDSKDIEEYLEYDVFEIDCNDRDPPSLPDVQLEESFCEPWGPGKIHTIISVTNDNSVFVWERRFGEWDIFGIFVPPVAGAIGFFLIGLLISLLMWFNKYLDGLRQKALEESD